MATFADAGTLQSSVCFSPLFCILVLRLGRQSCMSGGGMENRFHVDRLKMPFLRQLRLGKNKR